MCANYADIGDPGPNTDPQPIQNTGQFKSDDDHSGWEMDNEHRLDDITDGSVDDVMNIREPGVGQEFNGEDPSIWSTVGEAEEPTTDGSSTQQVWDDDDFSDVIDEPSEELRTDTFEEATHSNVEDAASGRSWVEIEKAIDDIYKAQTDTEDDQTSIDEEVQERLIRAYWHTTDQAEQAEYWKKTLWDPAPPPEPIPDPWVVPPGYWRDRSQDEQPSVGVLDTEGVPEGLKLYFQSEMAAFGEMLNEARLIRMDMMASGDIGTLEFTSNDIGLITDFQSDEELGYFFVTPTVLAEFSDIPEIIDAATLLQEFNVVDEEYY